VAIELARFNLEPQLQIRLGDLDAVMPRLKVLGLDRLWRPAPRHDNSGHNKRDQDYSPTLALRRRDEFLPTHPGLLFVSIGSMAGYSEFDGLGPILHKARLATTLAWRDANRVRPLISSVREHRDLAEPDDVGTAHGGEPAARCMGQKRL